MNVILNGAQHSEESLFIRHSPRCFAEFILERSEGLSMTTYHRIFILLGALNIF